MLDEQRWWRLLDHLLTEALTYSGSELEAERAAVLIYSAIWRRLNDPKGSLSN